MDYRKLDYPANAETGSTLTLMDEGEPVTAPDGSPMTVTVMGADSAAYKKAAFEYGREAIKAGDDMIDYDLVASRTAALLAVCTKAWSYMPDPATFEGATKKDGTLDVTKIGALECTPENARAIYSRFPSFAEQVDAHIHNRANFTPASKRT